MTCKIWVGDKLKDPDKFIFDNTDKENDILSASNYSEVLLEHWLTWK